MTDRYLRSTDGSDASDGLSWANAKATLAGIAAVDGGGDRTYVSASHAESVSSVSAAMAGTAGAPSWILCVDDSGDPEPPTAVAATATITATGAVTLNTTTSAYLYYHGISFEAGSGASSTQDITLLGSVNYALVDFDECKFRLLSTGTNSRIYTEGGSYNDVRFTNCWVRFAATAQRVTSVLQGEFRWTGGGIEAGGSAITTLFDLSANQKDVVLEGLDLSAGASSLAILNGASWYTQGRWIVRNCKLPASWSGSLMANRTISSNARAEMYNCDSGDTNYNLVISDYFGDIVDETTLVRTGGASDGTTIISHKFTSTSIAEYPRNVLRGQEIVRWNDTTGSAITVTVEILHDSATALKDNEIWLDVQYLGTSGFPLGSFVDDAAADVLATAADQTSSSETWTTTGMSNPNKQKLSVTFTPQEKGFIHAVVKLAKASYTVYVDPKLTVS